MEQANSGALALTTYYTQTTRGYSFELSEIKKSFVVLYYQYEREQLVGMFKVRLKHVRTSFIVISRERVILSRYPLVRDLGTCCQVCDNYKA
jgi:hypothetical protein